MGILYRKKLLNPWFFTKRGKFSQVFRFCSNKNNELTYSSKYINVIFITILEAKTP